MIKGLSSESHEALPVNDIPECEDYEQYEAQLVAEAIAAAQANLKQVRFRADPESQQT